MTAHQPKWENAVSIGEMSFYGDPRWPKLTSHSKPCACGAILSVHNPGDTCFVCTDRDAGMQEMHTRPTKADIRLAQRLEAALRAAMTLSQPFTSGDLARSLSVEPNAAHFLLRKLVGRGEVRTMGRAVPTGRALKGRASRRAVLMWQVM